MRISHTRLYWLADLKKAHIFITLDNVYITYKKKEYQFTGKNKNKKAWDFLNCVV